jgi:hypothetical protein
MGFGFDDIAGFFEDVSSVAGDVVEAGASLFDGPGGIAGIFVSGTMLFVGGPTALVPAIIAGVGATESLNALIKTRGLSPEERTIAELVFGDSLPYDKIILTNLWHPQGRAFTIPNAAGESLINLGDHYNDPIRDAKGGSYPEYGQLLIHELTHSWQIHHESFMPGLICEGISNQIRNELMSGIYDPGRSDDGRSWSDFNAEQQGTIIDTWYSHGCSASDNWYRYVLTVSGGTPPVARAISVRNIAKRKFGVEDGFSIKSRFPRYPDSPKTRSLRKSLIGLKG